MFVTILDGPARCPRFQINCTAREAIRLASNGVTLAGTEYRMVGGMLGDQVLAAVEPQPLLDVVNELRGWLAK